MIAWRQCLLGLLLAAFLMPPTMADDQALILRQVGIIQSVNLGAGLIQIGDKSYRLAPALKVFTPNGRVANPAILQQGQNIRFTTIPDSTVVNEIYVGQVD